MSINKVILLGNVGHTPKIGTFEGGNMWAKFSMATSCIYKNKEGEKITDTEWHNCVAYGKICEVISKYVSKGKQLAVIGKLRTRSYERGGVKKYITEIIINDLTLLGGGNDNRQSAPPPPDGNESKQSDYEEEDDDLPF